LCELPHRGASQIVHSRGGKSVGAPMLINNFHVMGGEPDEKPMHFFGLGVEAGAVVEDSGNPGEFLTLDLIGADWMQQRWDLAAEGLASPSWREAL
jgi:hypothetical protein